MEKPVAPCWPAPDGRRAIKERKCLPSEKTLWEPQDLDQRETSSCFAVVILRFQPAVAVPWTKLTAVRGDATSVVFSRLGQVGPDTRALAPVLEVRDVHATATMVACVRVENARKVRTLV